LATAITRVPVEADLEPLPAVAFEARFAPGSAEVFGAGFFVFFAEAGCPWTLFFFEPAEEAREEGFRLVTAGS